MLFGGKLIAVVVDDGLVVMGRESRPEGIATIKTLILVAAARGQAREVQTKYGSF